MYVCVCISLIKHVSSGPPCCFGVVRLVLSIHDNFGDENGISEDFYGRKGERHPKHMVVHLFQYSLNLIRCH